MIERKLHPVYQLPISQTAFMAEMIGTSPISKDELYVEMMSLWDGMPKKHFNTLLARVVKTLDATVDKDNGISITAEQLQYLREAYAIQRQRVIGLIRVGKTGYVSLTTIADIYYKSYHK